MLIEHAQDELQRAGLFDKDADYDGNVAIDVMELIKTFAAQGHSGGSAAQTVDLFTRLADFEPLTPITSNPEEWMDVSEESGCPMWQSKRKPTVFSVDGGKTWYDLDAEQADGKSD